MPYSVPSLCNIVSRSAIQIEPWVQKMKTLGTGTEHRLSKTRSQARHLSHEAYLTSSGCLTYFKTTFGAEYMQPLGPSETCCGNEPWYKNFLESNERPLSSSGSWCLKIDRPDDCSHIVLIWPMALGMHAAVQCRGIESSSSAHLSAATQEEIDIYGACEEM